MPMNMNQKDIESIRKQLSGIKLWIAVGAIGFLLIGVAATVFSFSIATAMSFVEEDYEDTDEESSWWNESSEFFDRGEKDKLLALVEYRIKTHPYDAQVYWFRAKAHILDENWKAALADVEYTQFLAPSWSIKYTVPMAEVLRKKIADDE